MEIKKEKELKLNDIVYYITFVFGVKEYYTFNIIGETSKYWKIQGLKFTNLKYLVDKKTLKVRGLEFKYIGLLTDEIKQDIDWLDEKKLLLNSISDFKTTNFEFKTKQDLRNFVNRLNKLSKYYNDIK